MPSYQRQQLRNQSLRQQRTSGTQTFSQRAPIGGWNTRDDVGNMPPEDAELLDNWVPDVGVCRLRNGSQHSRSVTATEPVRHEFETRNPTLSRLLVMTRSTISATTASGTAELATGLIGSGFWQCANFSARTFMVNGTDTPKVFNDSTSSYTDSPPASDLSDMAFTGPTDMTKLSDVHVFKGRLLFAERGSADFWYADVDVIQGTLTNFPLSRVARRGGHLLKITSWTVDGGEGPDDYAVFIMSTGEVVVYQGNDPSRSSAWGLVGRYYIGEPISQRCVAAFGGNVIVATTTDLVTMPAKFSQPQSEPTKLSGAIKTAVDAYRTLEGWQLLWYPKGPWLILNVPTGVASSEQYLINMRTASPTKFTGWNTTGFEIFREDLFYGSMTQQHVFAANVGFVDATSASTTVAITGRCWTAPTNCGVSWPKNIVDYRKMLTSEGTVTLSSGLVFDFSGHADFYQQQSMQANGTLWGGSWHPSWAEEDFARHEWHAGGGDGEYIQLRSEVTAAQQTPKWFKTQYRYTPVGPLE